MNSKGFADGQDIPLGLSMAMAQNPLAFDYFAKLTTQQKQDIINDSKKVRTRSEMHAFTDSLAHGEIPGSTGIG